MCRIMRKRHEDFECDVLKSDVGVSYMLFHIRTCKNDEKFCPYRYGS